MEKRLKFEWQARHFLLDLAQIGLGIAVWWTMGSAESNVWVSLALAGVVLAGMNRSEKPWVDYFRFLILGFWAYALHIGPEGGEWFLYIAAFIIFQLVAVGAKDLDFWRKDLPEEDLELSEDFPDNIFGKAFEGLVSEGASESSGE